MGSSIWATRGSGGGSLWLRASPSIKIRPRGWDDPDAASGRSESLKTVRVLSRKSVVGTHQVVDLVNMDCQVRIVSVIARVVRLLWLKELVSYAQEWSLCCGDRSQEVC